MTLLLGVVAAILLLAIVALIVQQNNDDGGLDGFTLPADLTVAEQHALVTSPSSTNQGNAGPLVGIAPEAVKEQTFEEILAAKEAEAQQTFSLGSFLPGNLGVGTKLTYGGTTSTIFGVIRFDFKGVVWNDYLAQHGEGQWWRFGVEHEGKMKFEAFEHRHIAIEPGAPTIDFEGTTFTMTYSGQASYRTSGQVNLFESGRYWYFDYENNAGVIIGFERFDSGPWVTSIGRHIDPRSVQVSNAVEGF